MISWAIKNEVQNFVSKIENKKILDFGCGDSRYKKLISNSNNYIGIDVVESGHPNYNKKHDLIWDKKKLPFENDFFDLILMTEVLEHLENVELTLKELHRVLKNNGAMLITVPFLWKEHEKPYDFQRYTSYGLKNLLIRNGFEITSQRKLVEKKLAILELINSEFNSIQISNLKGNKYFYFNKFYYFFLKNFFKLIFKFFISKSIFKDYYIGNSIIVKKLPI